MYRQRETEVAKLRTKIELAMNSHEEAMSMAKIQFTQELDRLQKELSTIKEPSATQQAYVSYLIRYLLLLQFYSVMLLYRVLIALFSSYTQVGCLQVISDG